jgi:hypothetical protein
MEKSLKEQIAGAWSLVSFEQELPSGQRYFPLGKDASGTLYYLPEGYVSVHIMETKRSEYVKPSLYHGKPLKYTDLEYLAYSGVYTINFSETIMIHKITVSLYPEWVGSQQVRRIKLFGNHLLLSSDGPAGPEQVSFHLLWKRL